MDTGIHILASRLIGQQNNLTVIADNVANVNTHGFKRLVYDFEEVNATNKGQHIGDYTRGIGVLIDHSGGPLENTGNPLDVAIIGNAFFGVETPNGQVQYTRNGNFSKSADGTLIDAFNRPVLDNAGAPIGIPPDATTITITPAGSIATEQGLLADIGLYTCTPEEIQQLNRAGGGGYLAPEGVTPQQSFDATVLQGKLEASNVNPIDEVVKLQELNRAYQSNFRSIGRMQDLEERAVRSLSAMPN